MAELNVLLTILGLSLLPPVLFAVWVRNRERHEREPLGAIFVAFGWGATVGVAVAFVLNTLFNTAATTFAADTGLSAGFLTAVLAAPVVEEATKGLGMMTQRRRITEPEDGLVYGAALGLGFAATENLLYGITAFVEDGIGVAFWTLVLRILSSMILHAAASAFFGYGYGLVVLGLRPRSAIFYAYLLAAFLHAAYNVLASLATLLGLVLALTFVWALLGVVRRRIERLDAQPPA